MADNIVRRTVAEGVKRRLVTRGGIFTSDELAEGLVELEEVPEDKDQPPEEDQVEPWGLADDAPEEKHRRLGHRLREYRREHAAHGD